MQIEAAWPPYSTSSQSIWNLRRVVHLHRRAGFNATWSELQRDLAGDPQEAVTRLLQGKARSDGQPSDFNSTAGLLTDAAVASGQDRRLKASWIFRMLFGPDPLGERLVLLWHDHFATSNRKVDDLQLMQRQNSIFRQHARGKFGELLSAAVHDPAMLTWLDADRNRKGHPNENLARELLELFVLGIGNYTESDVQETARALTGWRVVGDEFGFDERAHDDGAKTILGETGNFDGDRALAIARRQPATARRVAWRICSMLLGPSQPESSAFDALAAGLVERELDIAWGVETVLRSARFFGDENILVQFAAPPQYVIGLTRALEYFDPPPSTLLLAEWMARMGQDLFYPPNVGGWKGGKAWLSTDTLVARTNFAAALVAGRLGSEGTAPQIEQLVARHAGKSDPDTAVTWLAELLYGGLAREVLEPIKQTALAQATSTQSPLNLVTQLLLVRPEAHLA